MKLEIRHIHHYPIGGENALQVTDIINNKHIALLDGEIFMDYPLNDCYMVSNLGRVKSKDRIVKHNYGGLATRKGIILTQTDNGGGYLSVGLTNNYKTKTTRVNRMVAITFIDNPNNKPQVNHINGNKHDNRVCNLEWSTCSENVMHAWNIGLSKKRNSFLYITNRLSSINSYIAFHPRVVTPLGIGTVIIDQASYRIIYDNDKIENLVKSIRQWKDDFKLILKPLPDLYKEIDGKVGIVELAKIEHPCSSYHILRHKVVEVAGDDQSSMSFKYDLDENYFINSNFDCDDENYPIMYQLDLFTYLFSHHYDVFGLIDKGLAIDLNSKSHE